MKIGLLTVGTEILLGDTINTNLSSLGKILYNSGYSLNTELTVSDNEEEIIGGFKYLENKNDLIIICGGLGPTEDDITKEVISKYLNFIKIGLRISNGRLYAIRGNYQFLTVVESRKYINFGEIPETRLGF